METDKHLLSSSVKLIHSPTNAIDEMDIPLSHAALVSLVCICMWVCPSTECSSEDDSWRLQGWKCTYDCRKKKYYIHYNLWESDTTEKSLGVTRYEQLAWMSKSGAVFKSIHILSILILVGKWCHCPPFEKAWVSMNTTQVLVFCVCLTDAEVKSDKYL